MSIRHGPDPRPGDLDPLDEPGRWEALVGRIGDRAAPHLEARREAPGVLDVVARWARPALASAASLLLLAVAGSLAVEGRGDVEEGSEVVLAEALVPSSFAAWISGTSEPTVTDLVLDLETLEEV